MGLGFKVSAPFVTMAKMSQPTSSRGFQGFQALGQLRAFGCRVLGFRVFGFRIFGFGV